MYSELPQFKSLGANLKKSEKCIEDLLNQDLPKTEKNTVSQELRWNFVLDKHSTSSHRSVRRKKQFLTRKERIKCNLLQLPKSGWNYASLENMRELWSSYMRRNLDLLQKAPNCYDFAWNSLGTLLAKVELIGVEISVVRSTIPSLIGITGTVILETKSTLQIITPKSQLKSKNCI